MYNLLLVLHLIITVVLVLVILVQTGKGAEVGAVFGGGGAVFGGVGATTLLHKMTIGLGAAFMLTSLLLAIIAPSQRKASTIFKPITSTTGNPAVPFTAPAGSDLPGSAPAAESAPVQPAAPAAQPAGN